MGMNSNTVKSDWTWTELNIYINKMVNKVKITDSQEFT